MSRPAPDSRGTTAAVPALTTISAPDPNEQDYARPLRFSEPGHRRGPAHDALPRDSRALAGRGLVRSAERKLHADGGASARSPGPDRRALPARDARGFAVDRLDRSAGLGLLARAQGFA